MASEFARNPKNWKKTSDKPGYYFIPMKEKLGYASIDFAMNLVFQCIGLYISFFYTDIFGLKPGHVALLFLFSRFWDAVNDPMMGTIVERLNPKRGKYWVYIMWGSIPFGVVAVLAYSTPNFGYTFKLIWAAITYNLLNMLYTFIIQPYASAASIMTNDPEQRTNMQSLRMTLAQAGGVVCAIMLPNLSGFLTRYMSLAKGYMVTTMIMAAVMIVLLQWGSHQMVERIPVAPPDPNNKPNITTIFQVIRLRPVFVSLLLFLGVYSISQLASTMGAYYITYYAERPDMLSTYSMLLMLASVLGVPCTPILTKTIKKKATVVVGLAFTAVGSFVIYFMPQSALAGMLVGRFIVGFGYGILMGILWSLITDPIEYVHWKTGRNLAAITLTLVGLGLKFAMIIGGYLPNKMLDNAGYVANQTQTAECLNTIKSLMGLFPGIVAIVTIVIFVLFYNLNEEKVESMQADIAKREGLEI